MPEKFNKILAANVDKLPEINAFVEECADYFKLDPKKKFGLLIAIEEVFVNVCKYSYPDHKGLIEVSCDVHENALVVQVSDTGNPFNILLLPDPDTTLALDDREIGGLGGYFIRKFADSVSYQRENDHNVLKMRFNRYE